MKKLMALCLSVLMVLSMVSFTVMAEEVAAAATFADVANSQPANFVTGNLVLGENTITSSNEAVIALDGTVNRPIYEDAKVTVAVNGGNPEVVTVKAKTVAPLYTNDFSKDFGTGWSFGKPDVNDPCTVEDGVFKMVIGPTGSGRTNNYFYPAAASGNGIITMEFDIANVSNVGSGADIRISGNRYDADGNKIGDFNTITIARCTSNSGFGNITNWISNINKHVVFKYNPTTGEVWGNGKIAVNNLFTCAETNFKYNEGKSAADCAKVIITSFNFCNAGGGCESYFDMDNFVYYQEVSAEDALASATPAEKVATYSKYLDESYITNGRSLASLADNLILTPDAALPAGVEIVWSAADSALIANDGTVNRPLTDPASTTLTGKILVDGEVAFSKTHNVTVLPHTMVFMSETADAENLSVGNLAGVDNWTPSAVKSYELMEVVEEAGNKFFRFSTNNYEPAGSYPKYTFKNVPVYQDGDTIVFEAKFKMPAKPSGGYGTNFEFYLNENQMNEFIYMSGYIYDNDYTTSVNDYHGGGGRTDQAVTAGQWYNLRMEVSADASVSTGYIAKSYINDRLVGTTRTYAAIPANITSASFRVKGRQNADSTTAPTKPNLIYDIDDIKVYTTRPLTNLLPSLSEADRVSYFKGLIEKSEFGAPEAGKVFDLDKTYEAFDLASCNTTITWTSSNPEFISNDGAVLKMASLGQSEKATLTATITSGSVTDTVSFDMNIGVQGTSVLASKDNEGLTGTVGKAEYAATGDSHGTAIRLTSPNNNTIEQSFSDIECGDRTDRLIFSADYKFTPATTGASGGIKLKTYGGATGFQLQFYYDSQKIGFITTDAHSDASGVSAEVRPGASHEVPMPQHIIDKGPGEWVNIVIDYNPLSQSMQVYLDGVLLNEIPFLQANMDLGSNGGNSFRGYILFNSTGKGESWLDNVTVSKYTDADVVEVNAALNAALIDYASEYIHPVLTNRALPAHTIGMSWVGSSCYNRDVIKTETGVDKNGNPTYSYAYKLSNVSTFKYVEDGPAITWTIDGVPATEINVKSPKTVTITVTASKNDVTMSKKFTKQLAPVAIHSLALGTDDCLNGAWLDGVKGDEKLIVAAYQEGNLVTASVVDLATSAKFNSANNMIKDLGYSNPKANTGYDQIKLFIVAADGITPLTYANTELHD